MIKRSVRIELDSLLNDLRINLENNYKDLAHDALKKLHETLEDDLQNGALKERDYRKYKKIADDYSAKMADYHH
ncbi:MAG: hypothetical protein NC300_07330 [Bacteroidales bacterium]|nr:hypothetical protein [Clostridium sp.]MCM1203939.1 hypothetical protein [Bacteroidales bacterium]